MSFPQKLFLVHPRTDEAAEAHLLNTFTVYWPPYRSRPLYSWGCACGRHLGRWLDTDSAEASYTRHSGVTLPAWPPMDQAVEVTPTPTHRK